MSEKTKLLSDIQETAEITSAHWQQIKALIAQGKDYQTLQLAPDLEFRLVPVTADTWSAILAYQNRDVFHFMWEEVTGLVNISHRIVSPAYRGQGIASEVLYAIEQRIQNQSNEQQVRFSLMIETTQLAVVKLGLKRDMTLTRGKQVMNDQEQPQEDYTVGEKTHVMDRDGNRMIFRLSKAFTPLSTNIIRFTDITRTNVLQTLKAKAA